MTKFLIRFLEKQLIPFQLGLRLLKNLNIGEIANYLVLRVLIPSNWSLNLLINNLFCLWFEWLYFPMLSMLLFLLLFLFIYCINLSLRLLESAHLCYGFIGKGYFCLIGNTTSLILVLFNLAIQIEVWVHWVRLYSLVKLMVNRGCWVVVLVHVNLVWFWLILGLLVVWVINSLLCIVIVINITCPLLLRLQPLLQSMLPLIKFLHQGFYLSPFIFIAHIINLTSLVLLHSLMVWFSLHIELLIKVIRLDYWNCIIFLPFLSPWLFRPTLGFIYLKRKVGKIPRSI